MTLPFIHIVRLAMTFRRSPPLLGHSPLLLVLLLLPLSSQLAASSDPLPSDLAGLSELLTARYAPNSTWTESAVTRLATAVQRAVTCDAASCGSPPTGCVPAQSLLDGLGPEAVTLERLCPVVLHQAQQPGCLARLAKREAPAKRSRPSPAEVWGYGVLFVTVISLSSIFAVLLLPLLGRVNFERLMPGLIGLAVGSLSSSALFHLIPQAFGMVVEGAGHGYLNTSLCVLAGAWFFFMIERLMKITLDFKKRRSSADGDEPRLDSVLESPGTRGPCSSPSSSTVGDPSTGCGGVVLPSSRDVKATHLEPVRAMFGQVEEKPHSHHHHDHELALRRGSGVASEIAIVAWMIIFGDGFHNFLDGLSIGAAFSENILTGISISLAVLCEELPHELGDFAVLLDAGMTVRQAVVYNFLSACTCYLGLVLGVLIGDFTESTSFVFALAAGMFLYIALVDMVPEMNEAAEKASSISVYRGLRVLLAQNIGILLGVFSLFALAYFSDSLTIG
ncbi:metal cation symporter ZIP14-like isoform X1 [Amphibalanus amphitrite]|uniref:metal cation symporter ZIP14-like isoform X1 n=2 Tax=Amphibalanus amphitrite TaxID=1232801 RepID=UPI001C901650|nr:metal cation symporter ZIP14-like isoform X1 [Amphibalanus amphitrite]